MLYGILSLFSGVVKLLVTLLPVGPDIPQSVSDIIVTAVSTAKGLEPLMASSHALICIVTIALYEIGFAGFRAVTWMYTRVRAG